MSQMQGQPEIDIGFKWEGKPYSVHTYVVNLDWFERFLSSLMCWRIHLYRDNYNFLGMPDKMSGQINVSLTFASYRNF